MNTEELRDKCYDICDMWSDLSEMVQEAESEESKFITEQFAEAVRETYKLIIAINRLSNIPLDSNSEISVRNISRVVSEISGYIVYADDWANRYSNASGAVSALLLSIILHGNDFIKSIYCFDPEDGLLVSSGEFVNSETGEDIEWTNDVEKGDLISVIKALDPRFEE